MTKIAAIFHLPPDPQELDFIPEISTADSECEQQGDNHQSDKYFNIIFKFARHPRFLQFINFRSIDFNAVISWCSSTRGEEMSTANTVTLPHVFL